MLEGQFVYILEPYVELKFGRNGSEYKKNISDKLALETPNETVPTCRILIGENRLPLQPNDQQPIVEQVLSAASHDQHKYR